jgi:DNA repair exonuclease SbcCD ATPase subunit
MAEKRAEIDANLSPSARARNGFDDDDDDANDAADAFPPQPPPPVSTEPPMKSVELALDDFDVASLKRNLELAIATIREMQQRLVASNRAIETATAERNAARRDLARAERDVQRLAAAANARARQRRARAGVERAAGRVASGARGAIAGDCCPCC